MAEYIKLEDTIAIIEEKQKELCPLGRYGRGYVYGSDREKYDAWDEIIDALENIPAADVAPVVHGQWTLVRKQADGGIYGCSKCRREYTFNSFCYHNNFCPNCGAKMDGGAEHEAD